MTTNPIDSSYSLEEELFEDYEPDFEEEVVLETVFDANSQVIIRYGTEEFIADADPSKTLQDLVNENRRSLGVTDVSRLNFKVQSSFVGSGYIPKAGEVVVASANADTKG